MVDSINIIDIYDIQKYITNRNMKNICKRYGKRDDFSHIKVQETVKVFISCCMGMRQPVFLYGKNNDRGRSL